DNMDHNKQSGNNSVEVRYKMEVEEILNRNCSSLTSKVLDSSLNIGDLDNPFNKNYRTY
ncbi:11407_t:CDS:1, partial [Funneliformis geosporum]